MVLFWIQMQGNPAGEKAIVKYERAIMFFQSISFATQLYE